MKLSIEIVKELARLEREMDSGERPFVNAEGGRMAVSSEVMEELGLQSGQRVSNPLVIAILEANIRRLNEKIADLAFEEAEISFTED